MSGLTSQSKILFGAGSKTKREQIHFSCLLQKTKLCYFLYLNAALSFVMADKKQFDKLLRQK